MKTYYPLFLTLISLSALGQGKAKLSHYDENWKSTKLKTAYYHVEQVKLNDTCYEWNYYLVGHPCFLSLQFRDEQGKQQHGGYKAFRSDGYVDTAGDYLNGKREGLWYIMASNNRTLKRLRYANDVLIATTDSTQLNKEYEARKAAYLEEKKMSADTSEIESEFPGKSDGWRSYLTKNLRYPDESIKRNAQGMVIIQFMVEKNGKIEGPEMIKSVEYFIDKEAMRLIVSSPNWIPAVQFGKKVRSYKKQPIIFRLQ